MRLTVLTNSLPIVNLLAQKENIRLICTGGFFSMKELAFYGSKVCSMRQSLEIMTGIAKVRKVLNVPDGVALIMMECTYQDRSGRTIEYSKSFHRSDKCSFKIHLHKP